MSIVAGAGTTTHVTVGRRIATGTRPANATTILGSGLPSPQLTRPVDAGLLTHGRNPVPFIQGQKADTLPMLVTGGWKAR